MKRMQVVVMLMALCAGCHVPPLAPAVAIDAKPMTRTELLFGMSRPGGGAVSDQEWQAFVDDTIAPGFPSGFTIIDAVGQYRDSSGKIAHERAKILLLLHDGSFDAIWKLNQIRAEYKKRFKQESVIRESGDAWVSF